MAPKEVIELVEHFERNLEQYRSLQYKEAEARHEFIDPLFEALGWDVRNTRKYAEAYKDVVHEPSLESEDAPSRAPDYRFQPGGHTKFFVEAKKPSINLDENHSPALQLRRYGWTQQLAISILTNFAEFAVYDCRVEPTPADGASTARVFYLTFREYADRWDELFGLFSPEAVFKGSFDRFAETRKRKGVAPFDERFLDDMEDWRKRLAGNIALRNSKLSQLNLNYAVQQTIDRILFLRICEARGIEPFGRLRDVAKGSEIYRILVEHFRLADDEYNSGLFHFRSERGRLKPDELTPALKIDDDILRTIVDQLYWPARPYAFEVVPADILGHVYERFLGKLIHLTPAHRATIQEKPEVKKAGGVYYTPTYIVDYIVKNTVGKLLEGKTPKQASQLRILDPACGSGSFLLGAYDFLLKWYLDAYVAEGPEKHKQKLYQGPSGWKLAIGEKKQILLNNIYGVDIDPQAVEVTKLSLLLKVLEGESEQTAKPRLIKEPALPDLDRNIKCGNSLIGNDFEKVVGPVDEETRVRVNPFDWADEFPEIMKRGGFDAVVGNPPYVRQETLKQAKRYFEARYRAYQSGADLYVYFLERAASLLKDNGLFSMIVSSSLLRAAYGRSIRGHLRQSIALLKIVDFGGLAVFANAKDTYVCIPVFGRVPQPDQVQVSTVTHVPPTDLETAAQQNHYAVPVLRLTETQWSLDTDAKAGLFTKLMATGKTLGQYVDKGIFYGIKTGLNEAFEIDAPTRQRLVKECPASATVIKPFVSGEDIRRYFLRDRPKFVIALRSGWTRTQINADSHEVSERDAWAWLNAHYAPVARHLEGFREAAKARQDSGEYWWELRPCDYYDILDRPKIIYPDIAKGPRFFLDTSGSYIANTAYCLGTSDRYLLGILNSRLSWFSISSVSIPFGTRKGSFRYRLIYQYMEKVPIRALDLNKPIDKDNHDHMVRLVDRMLRLQVKLASVATGPERSVRQRQLDATDREIDQLVYQLYGLTDDEIALVESATAPAPTE